jgi:murein DD-endopeptidase MepM/ murein hydrolase activator NlpD
MALLCQTVMARGISASEDGALTLVSQKIASPRISVRVSPAQALPGDVVILRVSSDTAFHVLGWMDDRLVRFAPELAARNANPDAVSASSKNHIALLGLDALTPSGTYSVVITAVGRDGRATRIVQPFRVMPQRIYTERIALTRSLSYTLDLNENQQELDAFRRIYSDFSDERLWDGTLSMPVRGRMVAEYGNRRVYNGVNLGTYHGGIDIAAAKGTAVTAAATGRVVASQTYVAHGTTVVLDHGRGVFTAYSHLSQSSVNVGQLIQVGQVIGLVGSTGRSQGPHLHFELAVAGVTVDPMYWFRVALPS